MEATPLKGEYQEPHFIRAFLGSLSFMIGFVIILNFLALGATSFFWTPYDITQVNIANKLVFPGAEHWFGTDALGRDIFSMIMVGARVSILVALASVGIGCCIGIPLGLLSSAYYGGLVDEIIMRITDVVFAFPALITAMMILAVFEPGVTNIIVAISIFNIPVFSKLVRNAALPLWQSNYVLVAIMSGKGRMRIACEHILPNTLNVLIVQGAIQFSVGLLAEVGFAYLGLGVQPPLSSWGRMLSEAQTMIYFSPHLVFFPGIAIILSVFSFNLMGDGLRDIFDMKSKSAL